MDYRSNKDSGSTPQSRIIGRLRKRLDLESGEMRI